MSAFLLHSNWEPQPTRLLDADGNAIPVGKLPTIFYTTICFIYKSMNLTLVLFNALLMSNSLCIFSITISLDGIACYFA